MIGFSRIQRYIFAENARTLGTVIGVIIVSILMVDTVEQINTVGTRAEISFLDALKLSLMKLPSIVEQTLAFALLISAMLTFRQLSKRAELPVIRASGISAWKFLLPTLVLSISVGFFTMMAISPLGSHLSQQFESERDKLLGRQSDKIAVADTGIWLRDGNDLKQTTINAQSIDETGTLLSDVRFVQEDRIVSTSASRPEFQFSRRIEAKTAKLEQGFWQLEEVTEYVAGEQAVHFPSLSFATELKQATLIDRFKSPSLIGFWALPDYIRNSESIGINASKFKMRYQSLTAIPALFSAMSLMGALACLRLVRLGRTMPFIAFGAVSSIVLYFINQVGASFGSIGAIPPLIAAWTPPVFAVFVCLALVAFNEDG